MLYNVTTITIGLRVDMTDKEHIDTLSQKISEDIERTGYPTELTVGKILEQKGWELHYNVYYIDEDERKGREIDIVATEVIYHKELPIHIEYSLICAVKKSSKPWVVFSTEATGLEGGGWNWLHVSENLNGNILPADKIDANSTISQFRRLGHAYHVAFQNNNSSILEALSSAVKASEQHRKHYEEWYEEDRRSDEARKKSSKKYHSLVILEPMIILDGQLYEAYLNVEKKLIVKKVNHIPVCFGYISLAYKHAEYFSNYIVEIVTVDALSRLVSKKRRWLEGIKEEIAKNITKAT